MNAKALLRSSAARLLYIAGVTAPKRRARGRFSIIAFHRVLPQFERDAYPYPGLVVTPEELDSLLAYFSTAFDCGPLASQHERYLRGDDGGRPLLALTFDDAQHDNYANARAVLAGYGLKASFFAPVAAVERQEPLWHDRLGFAALHLLREGDATPAGLIKALSDAGIHMHGLQPGSVSAIAQAAKKLPASARSKLVADISGLSRHPVPAFARMMTFDELAALAREGHEIGSHSMTHRMMPECDDVALAYELGESRRILQRHIGQPIDSFCYPNGDCDERAARAVNAAGYRRAITTKWGDNDRASDPFHLRRFDMDTSRILGLDNRPSAAVLAFRMSSFQSLLVGQ